MEKIIVNRAEQQRRLVIADRGRGTLSVGEGGAVRGVSAWQVRRFSLPIGSGVTESLDSNTFATRSSVEPGTFPVKGLTGMGSNDIPSR